MGIVEHEIDTHHAIILFGKYKGERITRVPVSYLKWGRTNNPNGKVLLQSGSKVDFGPAALAEIARRGERCADVEVSAHAVDRMSLNHLEFYQISRAAGEGIFTWLEKKMEQALVDGNVVDETDGIKTIRYIGIVWIVDMNFVVPVLRTVK